MYKELVWFNRSQAEQLPSVVLRRYVNTYRYNNTRLFGEYYTKKSLPPIIRRLNRYSPITERDVRYVKKKYKNSPDVYQYNTVYVPGVVLIVYNTDYPDPEIHAKGTSREIPLYDYLVYDVL